MGFSKAKLEYEKEARRKKIVWSEKKTRIRDVIPSWRKKDDPQQPTTPYNKFAINIEKRLIASQESFDG